MKERCQIDQEIRSKFERTRDIVDRLLRIIVHDERVGSQRPEAVAALYLQTRYPRQTEMSVVY